MQGRYEKVAIRKAKQGYWIVQVCGTCKNLRPPKCSGVRNQCGIGNFAVDEAGVCSHWR
jgi:hypothetical protein